MQEFMPRLVITRKHAMANTARPDLPAFNVWLLTLLRFPLRPWLWPLLAAAFLIAAAVSLILPVLSPIPAGLLALTTMLSLWVLALRVACRILIATAAGAGLEREYRAQDLPENQAARQIGLWLIMALLIAAMNQSFGLPGLLLGLLTAVALLPAMTLLLVIDNSFEPLTRRSSWQALGERIGRGAYARLCFVLLGLSLTYLVLQRIGVAIFPGFLANGLMMAVWAYLLWVGFYALGLQLRLTSADRHEPHARTGDEPLDALAHRLEHAGGSLDERRRLFRGLEQRGDRDALLAYGPGFVSALLLSYDRDAEAVERAAALVALDPAFTLERPSTQLKLIEAARLYGDPMLVCDLTAAYLSAWPAAPGGDDARLIACEARAPDPDDRVRGWYRALVGRPLPEDLGRRMAAIASAYAAKTDP
ncbi:hypothetical protein AY599_21225 [Leptolyngbya valderiana BDU 20041]|nr:hypothetical protein AY599_21225 [Leptolyngbya valderiana BDU 20041]